MARGSSSRCSRRALHAYSGGDSVAGVRAQRRPVVLVASACGLIITYDGLSRNRVQRAPHAWSTQSAAGVRFTRPNISTCSDAFVKRDGRLGSHRSRWRRRWRDRSRSSPSANLASVVSTPSICSASRDSTVSPCPSSCRRKPNAEPLSQGPAVGRSHQVFDNADVHFFFADTSLGRRGGPGGGFGVCPPGQSTPPLRFSTRGLQNAPASCRNHAATRPCST